MASKPTPTPKTRTPNFERIAAQTMPVFRQTVKNLKNYGVAKQTLINEINAIYG